MIKQFYMLSPAIDNYACISIDDLHVAAGWLYTLFLSFNKYRDWIIIEEKNDKVYIWDIFDEDDFETWDDIHKVVLSKKNYDYILKKLKKFVDDKPKFFILSYDDNGWIDLEAKEELSQEDWQNIDQDKYEKLSKKRL